MSNIEELKKLIDMNPMDLLGAKEEEVEEETNEPWQDRPEYDDNGEPNE